MIDEKMLDQLEHSEREAMANQRCAQVLSFDVVLELIRLSRLGLWAEKYAVDALRKIRIRPCNHKIGCPCCETKEALAALPKDSK